MNKFITLALTGLSLIFSSSVLAEGFNNNYFSIGYLNSSGGKEINRKGATSGSLDGGNMKGGNGFMVAIGKHLDESPVSIELEYMSLKEDFIEFTTKDSSVTNKGSGFVERSGVFLTAKRHFESTSIATPYIGFGIGWQKDYWKIQNTAATIVVDDSDSAFNYGFLVGSTFDLSQSLQLNLDYRYRFMGELTGVSSQCGTTTCSDFSGTWEKYSLSTIAVSISKYF